MTHRQPEPAEDTAHEHPHPSEPSDTRQNPPRRNAPQGPLEDDQARSRKGHPSGNENFRGEP
jgi:hypothetical protein